MEGHRQLRLIVRAALDGVIDFSQADFLDPRWHARLHLLLEELTQQDYREFLKMKAGRELAYISSPFHDENSWAAHTKAEAEYLEDWTDNLFGIKTERGDRRARIAKAHRDAWQQEFGQMNDPETQRKIDETVASLRMQRDQARSEPHGHAI